MGMYIGAGYGSVGRIKSKDPYGDWEKYEHKIDSLAKKHDIYVTFRSQDQGNDGYYLAICSEHVSSENIYQDSIFAMDLSVEEDPEFQDKLSAFLNEFWENESFGDFNDIDFSEVAKLLFT